MTELDPKTRVLLDMVAALGEPPLAETSIEAFRVRRARGRAIVNPTSPPIPIVQDIDVEGAEGRLPARLYDVRDDERRPTLLFFHGGGFCYGDIESHDPMCRRLSLHGNMRVLSVDYRLAPEHPFPAATDDAIAAMNWVAANARDYGADPSRLAVGGDSAGACLAAVAARSAARAGLNLKFQLLVYPVVQEGEMTRSRQAFSEGYFLTQETMDWFRRHYLGDTYDAEDERVSPLRTPPPPGLAPALIVTAGFDPLIDEGRAYADALGAAGVLTEYKEYPSQIHGFFSFTAFSSVAEEAIEHAAKAVRFALDQ